MSELMYHGHRYDCDVIVLDKIADAFHTVIKMSLHVLFAYMYYM